MINAVEILFGLAAAILLGGIVLYVVNRPAAARRLFTLGLASLILALIGEIVLRVMP